MAYNTGIATEIHRGLSRLRRALRGRLAGEGLAWVLVVLVGAVFLTLAVDLSLKLQRSNRIIMASVVVLALMWRVWRELLAPLLAPMKSEDLAMLVERRHTQLGDRLISALQFTRSRHAAPNESAAMVAETIRQANIIAAPLDLADIVERRDLKRALAIGTCTVVLLAGFSLWQSRLMWPWFQRNVIFADIGYPLDTYLDVTGGPEFTVLRHNDLKVLVYTEDRSRAWPEHVTVHIHYPSEVDKNKHDDGWRETEVDLKKDAAGTPYYLVTFPKVHEEMSFYVTGGDDNRVTRAMTDKHFRITPTDPPPPPVLPALASIRFAGKFPDYLMHEQNREDGVEASLGAVTVPAGTTLTVSAEATKNLKSVMVTLGRVDQKARKARPDQPLRFTQTKTFEIVPTGRRFGWVYKFKDSDGSAGPNSSGSIDYQVSFGLLDTEGHRNKEVCGRTDVSVQLDKSPKAKTRKRKQRTLTPVIRNNIATYNATIPLTSEFTDDHDLGAAWIDVALFTGRTGKTVKHKIPISLRDSGQRHILRRRSVPKPNSNEEHGVDLRSYGLSNPDDDDSDGNSDGNEVTITVVAEDSLPPPLGGPNDVRSAPIVITIVKRGIIEEELSATAGRIRDEFDQTIDLQQRVRDGVRAAGLMLARGQKIDVVAPKLALLAGKQSAVGPECRKIVERISDILDARIYNRLDGEEYYENVRGKIIAPLGRLAEPLTKTAAATKHSANTKDRNLLQEQIISITETQDAILKVMADVKDEMDSESTRRDIINSCSRLIDWSKDQLKSIKKRSVAEAGSVFDKKKDKKDDKPKGAP